MKKQNIKKFKENYELIWWTLGGGILFFILAIYEQGINNKIYVGIMAYAIFTLLIWITTQLTYTSIKDSELLKCKSFLAFKFEGYSFVSNITNISRIDRTSAFIFKTWGSRLQIYYEDERGQESIGIIQESMYNVETLKEILIELKRINPSIELHPHYESLVNGSIEPDRKFKKVLSNKELPKSFL